MKLAHVGEGVEVELDAPTVEPLVYEQAVLTGQVTAFAQSSF